MSFPFTTLQLLCRESCGALCPHMHVRAMVCCPLLSFCGGISLLHPSQKTSFPHSMLSMFLAVFDLCSSITKLKSRESTAWGCAGLGPSLAVSWAAFCHMGWSGACEILPREAGGRDWLLLICSFMLEFFLIPKHFSSLLDVVLMCEAKAV